MSFGVKPPINGVQPVQPKKTGTGFTNINRILGANQGNKLGQSVSTSVQNQAADVKNQTQQSQTAFGEEAQKNRLDTDEASQKRDNIIGRFGDQQQSTPPNNVAPTNVQQPAVAGTQQIANTLGDQQALINKQIPAPKTLFNDGSAPVQPAPPVDKFAPDMSQFAVSSGLQDQYNQSKADYMTQYKTQQTSQQQAAAKQKAAIEAKLNADMAALQKLAPTTQQRVGGIKISVPNSQYQGLSQSVKSLQNVLSTFNSAQEAAGNSEQQQMDAYLADLDTQYQKSVENERTAFGESERDKLIAANMPTDQEINDFTKYRTGAYNGPQELGDFQTLLGNASEAQQVGDLTRSTGGRQELLRRFVGGDDYTQGQQRLDNLILGQSGSQDLNQARKSTQGLQQSVSDANSQAKTKAQEYVNRAKIFGDETVQKLNNVRNPISTKVDAQLKALQDQEADRGNLYKNVQDTISGANPEAAKMDKISRLGLGLQSAMDSGYITQDQAGKLLGDNGLIARAQSLGLDTNQLINERLSNNAGQNLNRGGAASSAQESQLTALDRLLGRQGADVEFNQKGADYQKGNLGLNLDSLNEYITKTEAEKAQKDPAYAEQLKKQNPSYLQQALGYTQGTIGNATGILNGATSNTGLVAGLAGGGALAGANLAAALGGGASLGGAAAAGTAGMAALPAALGFDMLTGGDTTARTANSAAQAGLGAIGATEQGSNAILQGLLKMNIGGASLANNDVGKNLLKLIDYKSQLTNSALHEGSQAANEITGQVGDLTSQLRHDPSKLLQFMATGGASIFAPTAGRVAGNVGKEIGKFASNAASGFGAGKTGHWATEKFNVTDANTGQSRKIGTYANESSANILKQMTQQGMLDYSSHMGNSGASGAKSLNKLVEYYNAAVKREAAAKKK